MKAEEIAAICERHQDGQGSLIAILQDIQSRYCYLPKEALQIVSQKTRRSMVDIYGVATFYRAFSLAPRGKHLASVCLGTACHVRGGPVIAEEFMRELQIKPGETTADREFTLETVNCLGACALGPIVVVDGHYFSNVSPVKAKTILEKARSGLDEELSTEDKRVFPVAVQCPRCSHTLMDSTHTIDGKPSIKVTISSDGQHGWLRLSSMYGSYVVESEYDIPERAVADFFCPHCSAHLTGAGSCVACEAPMVPLSLRGADGLVQVCSRRGCRNHLLDLMAEPA
jgi:NADH-quinone oxidoreductase subunit E